jgi:hypothetical protein
VTVPDAAPQPTTFEHPFLRATTGAGDEILDPSEDALHLLVESVEAGGEFVIVESLLPGSDGRYAQTVRLDDGSWCVEVRSGLQETHVSTVVADRWAAAKLLAGWAHAVDGWAHGQAWQPVVY